MKPIKNIRLPRRDFAERQTFPGTTGNIFDVILHRLTDLEKIPAPLFGLILALLAVLAARFQPVFGAALLGFFLTDWLLLALLPRRQKSFGPPKPPTLMLAVLRSLFAQLPWAVALPLQIIGTLLVIYGFWIEPHRIRVTYQKLSSPKFTPKRPLRILHLGDLHIERLSGRENELKDHIQQLKPDLILFSGDILNLSYLKDPLAWQAARDVLRTWQAPLGTYLVSGSPAVDLPENLPALLNDLPVRWLDDEKVEVVFEGAALQLVGLTCTHKPFLDAPRLQQLLTGSDPRQFTLLLHHSPDLAAEAAAHQVDLQLSGHTHGGQVCLPFYGALFTGALYGKLLEAGRYQIDQTTLYITRGIGLEGAGAPRVRFLCPPEIILWEIGAQ